jgi:hypothetical protein
LQLKAALQPPVPHDEPSATLLWCTPVASHVSAVHALPSSMVA